MTVDDHETGVTRVDDPSLFILLIGDGPGVEILRHNISRLPPVQYVEQATDGHHAWGAVRSGRVNTVIVDPFTASGGLNRAVLTIFGIRAEFPEIVFVIFADDDEFNALKCNVEDSVRRRLSHYYRLPKNGKSGPGDEELQKILGWCQDWHAGIREKRPYAKTYKYDVALSFAGEDRAKAEELADILRAHGVRVFYDTYERADLWGKDLFVHLYNVYSTQSGFCIAFISEHYVEKMWTVHERRSAQERVLKDRDTEYFLPIRIDDTPLPGLPTSVSFVHINQGVPDIATLFVRKLGGVLGTLS